ncbi:MAG: hypothetical protein H6577_14175 [Lewinellaceae bacterium]|nr:hypothetical protein [Saprospiraceae bacterium]MCB9339275.1 hypothetical protein [Lewinellaceae bacterium]
MRSFFLPITFLFLLLFSASTHAQGELTAKGGFAVNNAEAHNFLFLLKNSPNDLQELRTGITKYIWKYHPNDKLKITQIKIGGDLENVPLILVTGFDNKGQAMAFYNGLKKNRPDFLQMGMTNDYFALSKTNYEQIVRNKSTEGYKAFFEQNYLARQ